MEENYVAFESSANGDHEATANAHSNNNDHGWQKVTYPKRQRKIKPSNPLTNPGKAVPNGSLNGAENVFHSLEQQSEERRRRILEAQRAAANADAPVRSKHRSDDEDADESDGEGVVDNGKAEEVKKIKTKKPKKPKVTVPDAAAKIDADNLSAFLADISASFESQQIQLMRFADYFGRAFSAVSAAQFPWVKILRESTVAKLADIPLSHISEPVYKTSIDWINKHSLEELGSFVVWSLDSILADLVSQQAGAKGSKKGVPQASSKSQVAMFIVVAMVLRRKPDVLVNLLPTLRENAKYQGHDKLPIIIWMAVQSCQGDLAVGLYAWACNLLPVVSGKSCNTQSRDLVLQLVERILSTPKARQVLVNSAVRKGERLIPPSAFEILIRVTFPASSARMKATERFEAVYPTLKEVALAGSPGSKAMKQVSQQILSFAVKAAAESTPELSTEATDIFIWCLTQNANCFKQWDEVYEDNIEASVSILKKLSEEWKEHSAKLSSLEPLRELSRILGTRMRKHWLVRQVLLTMHRSSRTQTNIVREYWEGYHVAVGACAWPLLHYHCLCCWCFCQTWSLWSGRNSLWFSALNSLSEQDSLHIDNQWCKPSICFDNTQHGQSNPILPTIKRRRRVILLDGLIKVWAI